LARSLYWRNVDVDARLDEAGLLHVIETQVYIFTGDWNGGERIFNIRKGQGLRIEGVDRLEGDRIIPLTRGNLQEVDHYDQSNYSILRWRSRLPNDPEFAETELTYKIRYTLSGVLRGRNGQYWFAHDFCFPDRSGRIEQFSLRFELDPVWTGVQSPLSRQEQSLSPGQGIIVSNTLHYSGSHPPAGVIVVPPAWLGPVLLLVLTSGLMLLVLLFLKREKQVGRFGPHLPITAIDEKWLTETVFSLPPEVVGAIWDDKIGAAEVGAILAALVQEKKLDAVVEKSFLRRPKMSLRLLVDRKEVTGYRGLIVRKLFFKNRTNTDSQAIKKHYNKKGLDLVACISRPLENYLTKLPDWKVKTKLLTWKFDGLPLVITFVLLVASGIMGGGNDSDLLAPVGFIGIMTLIAAGLAAAYHAKALDNLKCRFAIVGAFLLPLIGGTGLLLLNVQTNLYHLPAMIAAILWNWAVCNLVFSILRINQTPAKIAVRQKQVAARAWFKAQLRSAKPQLQDDWYPYLVAFGLGGNVDSWFRSFGAAAGNGGSSSRLSSSSYSPSKSRTGTGWTGGGGAFGGAGACGSWVSAATAIGSGVSGPSRSGGSGGSSGGGGSSSGGGGGGGW